jgi:hypothetical protein
MLRSAIKSTPIRALLLTYFVVMLVFYPVSRMYANEYETVPIKFEFAFFMVFVGLISNTGIILALFDWGLRHKKITFGALVASALLNAFLLLITNGNPLQFASYEYWNTIRNLCFYGVFLVSGIICIFVGRYQNESP